MNAHDSSMSTVVTKSGLATWATTTIAVDFPDYASPRKRSRRSHSDEFMPKNASKSHVPLGKLQISLANTGDDHIDKHLS
jgi:hypothetical protein